MDAQDRFQIGLDLVYQGSQTQRSDYVSIGTDHPTPVGVAVAWRPLSLGRVDVHLVAGMRAKSSSDVEVGAGFRYAEVGTLDHQSLALGVEATWRWAVDLGGGLELRREQMTLVISSPTTSVADVTMYRPWITSHVGWSWKRHAVKPFVRGLLSVPLKEEKYTWDSGVVVASEQLAKALAPSLELGVQVGVSF